MKKLFRTQKANGIAALQTWKYLYQSTIKSSLNKVTVPEFEVIQNKLESVDEISTPLFRKALKDKVNFVFARPAPTTPEHGFVDSRPINSLEELNELWDETIKHDPNGEIILMPFLDKATSSGITTPTTISVGPNNDGATGAGSPLILNYNSHPKGWGKLIEDSNIPEDKDPYIETVHNRGGNTFEEPWSSVYTIENEAYGSTSLVQCRAGEKIAAASDDYVPEDVYVTKIVKPTGNEDFITWRNMVSKFEKGTVVIHPEGGLHTHWGVNTKEHGFTYITQPILEYTVGNTILSSHYKPSTFQHDNASFKEGVAYALRDTDFPYLNWFSKNWLNRNPLKTTYLEAAALMLFAFHNHQHQTPERGSRLLGLGIGYCIRLLQILCIAEYRHSPSFKYTSGKSKPSRAKVYKDRWPAFSKNQHKVDIAYRNFRDAKWPGSFGGSKWMRIARYQILLYDLCCELFRREDGVSNNKLANPALSSLNKSELMKNISNKFNETINVAHNCGWVFDKFAPEKLFNHAASRSLAFSMFCMHALEEHRTFIKHGMKKYIYDYGDKVTPFMVAKSYERLTATRSAKKTLFAMKWTAPLDTDEDYRIGLYDKSLEIVQQSSKSGTKNSNTKEIVETKGLPPIEILKLDWVSSKMTQNNTVAKSDIFVEEEEESVSEEESNSTYVHKPSMHKSSWIAPCLTNEQWGSDLSLEESKDHDVSKELSAMHLVTIRKKVIEDIDHIHIQYRKPSTELKNSEEYMKIDLKMNQIVSLAVGGEDCCIDFSMNSSHRESAKLNIFQKLLLADEYWLPKYAATQYEPGVNPPVHISNSMAGSSTPYLLFTPSTISTPGNDTTIVLHPIIGTPFKDFPYMIINQSYGYTLDSGALDKDHPIFKAAINSSHQNFLIHPFTARKFSNLQNLYYNSGASTMTGWEAIVSKDQTKGLFEWLRARGLVHQDGVPIVQAGSYTCAGKTQS